MENLTASRRPNREEIPFDARQRSYGHLHVNHGANASAWVQVVPLKERAAHRVIGTQGLTVDDRCVSAHLVHELDHGTVQESL